MRSSKFVPCKIYFRVMGNRIVNASEVKPLEVLLRNGFKIEAKGEVYCKKREQNLNTISDVISKTDIQTRWIKRDEYYVIGDVIMRGRRALHKKNKKTLLDYGKYRENPAKIPQDVEEKRQKDKAYIDWRMTVCKILK